MGGGDVGDGVDKCGQVGNDGVMGDNWVDCLSCQGQYMVGVTSLPCKG